MIADAMLSPVGDDASLARRVAAGEPAAFEVLMRRYNRRLYRLARAVLRDDADAEDALQEAYLSAYRAISDFRGDAALATWLSRLVLNECLGRLRRRTRRQAMVPFIDPHPDIDLGTIAGNDAQQPERPEQAFVRSELRAVLERSLDELPESLRTVFVLRCVEELSVEETAQSLGIPQATVRTRHFRARSRLREALAQEIDLAERDLFEFGGMHCDRVVETVMQRLAAGEPGA